LILAHEPAESACSLKRSCATSDSGLRHWSVRRVLTGSEPACVPVCRMRGAYFDRA
jgi:hypothetical protein